MIVVFTHVQIIATGKKCLTVLRGLTGHNCISFLIPLLIMDPLNPRPVQQLCGACKLVSKHLCIPLRSLYCKCSHLGGWGVAAGESNRRNAHSNFEKTKQSYNSSNIHGVKFPGQTEPLYYYVNIYQLLPKASQRLAKYLLIWKGRYKLL